MPGCHVVWLPSNEESERAIILLVAMWRRLDTGSSLTIAVGTSSASLFDPLKLKSIVGSNKIDDRLLIPNLLYDMINSAPAIRGAASSLWRKVYPGKITIGER